MGAGPSSSRACARVRIVDDLRREIISGYLINMGAVIIDGSKRVSVDADWNKIKAEFMTGASYGALAARYGIGKSTIYKKAQKENWPKQRERIKNAVETKTIERTANAAAENAVRLQEARAVAIAKVKAALEAMPEGSGSHVRRQINDGKTGLPITMDYDLPALVQALAKLTEETTRATSEDKNAPVYELLRRLDGESGV